MRAFVFAGVLVAVIAISCVTAAVTPLSAEQFVQQQAENPGVPTLVRFYMPWDGVEESTAAYSKASEAIPDEIAQFYEIRLEGLEEFVIADVHGVTQFPTVKLLGVNPQRPHAPKGAQIAGNPNYVAKDFSGNHSDVDALVEFVLRHTPTRAIDPISNHLTQTVLQIADEAHINALARAAPSTAKNGILFYLPSIYRSDKKHSHALAHNLVLSGIYAQAAVYNQQVLVFTTQDEEIAKKFGLVAPASEEATVFCEAAAFNIKTILAEKDAKQARKTVGTKSITNAKEVGEFFTEHALGMESFEKEIGYTSKQWTRDMTTYSTASPLRKLESVEQFKRDVTDNKQGAVVIFLLRESDKFFTKHYKTALNAAKWARFPWFTHPISGEKLKKANMMRYDIFWVDAEVHPEVGKLLNAKAVPAVGIVLSLQQQEGQNVPPKGIKFMPGPNYPDSDTFLNFINSEAVFEGRDILPFDPTAVQFREGAKTTQPQLATTTNNAYLGVDLRNYDEDEPETDVFELGKKRSNGDDDDSSSSKKKKKGKKVNSEREQLKKMKAEEEKKKLADELAKKKADKEARMKAKAEANQKLKEKDAEEAAKLKEDKKLNPEKYKKKKQPKKESKQSQQERLAKLRKSKPVKTTETKVKQWAKNGEQMAKKYMQVDSESGKIEVSQKLDLE